MSARQELSELLRTELAGTGPGDPALLVVSDARQLDTVKQPGAVVLWTNRRTRPDLARLSFMQDELTLWVLTATDKPSLIEDDLDALFERVVGVLEQQPAYLWTDAERGVLAERFDGYRLTITCVVQITDVNEPN